MNLIGPIWNNNEVKIDLFKALCGIFMDLRNIVVQVCCCFLFQSWFIWHLLLGFIPCWCHLMKDLQKLSIYHWAIHLLFNQAIYVKNSNFRIFLTTMIKLICNEIQYHDKVLTKTYMSQISVLSLFATLLLLIYPLPCKFTHEPSCVEMVLTFHCNKSHCKKSSLQLSNLILLAFNQAANQTGKIGSILPKCTQNLALNQKHIVELKHNNLKTMAHYTTTLQVDGIFEHMELQCIFLQFK